MSIPFSEITTFSMNSSNNNVNLSKYINLTKLDICLDNIHLDLTKCIHLTHLVIKHPMGCLTTPTSLNLDLSRCINLIHLELDILEDVKNVYYLNLSKCVNLKTYISLEHVMTGTYIRPFLPDLSRCLKLSSFKSMTYFSYIYDAEHLKKYSSCMFGGISFNSIDLSLFPNMTFYNGANVKHLCTFNETQKKEHNSNLRLIEYKFNKVEEENKELLKQHSSILSLIETKFNKLEEENKELRKIIDELRTPKSSYM